MSSGLTTAGAGMPLLSPIQHPPMEGLSALAATAIGGGNALSLQASSLVQLTCPAGVVFVSVNTNTYTANANGTVIITYADALFLIAYNPTFASSTFKNYP